MSTSNPGTFFVQIASPRGIVNEAELFRLAYGHNLSADAHGQLDSASADEPIYGWRAVATLDDEAVARRMVELAESGFGSDGGLVALVIARSDLSADELRQVEIQLMAPEREFGDLLREEAERDP